MSGGNPLEQVSLERLKARSSAKWRRYQADVLPLWVAEMDVDLEPHIAQALRHAVDTSDTGYPGTTPYIEALAEFAAARWNWQGLTEARVTPVASVIEGYTDALVQAAGPGGTVVITSPVYPPFTSYVAAAGLTVVEAPLTEQLRLDIAAIDAALGSAPGKTALLLCNPHNPGGTVHTREELQALADVIAAHGSTVVSDEIHAPLVYSDATFVPYLEVDQTGIALHAASKAWNLAAVPAALMVFGADANELRKAYRATPHHYPTHWGVIAQEAAYRHGGPWLDSLLTALEAKRELLRGLLEATLPNVGYHHPQSTYLAWLDCRELGLGDDPAAVFLDKGRVALNSGPTFGGGGAGHVRLNFATRADILEEAVARMAASL